MAEDVGGVVGWGCLRPFRAKAAYRFTAEDSVYIHPDHRGRGVGTLILASLIEKGREKGFTRSWPASPRTTRRVTRLHKAFGFELVGNEREVGYKFERWLDVSWWQLMLVRPSG